MKSLAFALALVVGSIVAPALALADAPADQVLNDASQTADIDCGEGGNVTINGASNTLTLTGTCGLVSLNGASNTVSIVAASSVELHGTANTLTVTAADKIMVTGSGNKVSYGRKGLTTKRPKLAKLGVRNKYKVLK